MPIMRQLALRKINLVEILLDIFHLVITEKKLKKVGEASFHEFVEELIIEDDAIEQVIQNIQSMICIKGITRFSIAQPLPLLKKWVPRPVM